MPSALRTAVRSLSRSRAYTTLAVGTLSAALGVALAAAALVNGVLHPPAALRDAEHLLLITSRGDGADHRVTAGLRLRGMREVPGLSNVLPQAQSLEPVEVGAYAHEAVVARVSPGYFNSLGVVPEHGRFFAQDGEGAVVSYAFWREALGGGSIAGRYVRVGDRSVQVIGVAPHAMMEILPITIWLAEARDERLFADATSAIVRLSPGATRPGLRRQLADASRLLAAQYGVGRFPFGFDIRPLARDPLALADSHRALLFASLAIVLMACGNLATLVLARVRANGTEIAVRRAVGARRRDIMRSTLTECLLVSAAGTLIGLALARAMVGALRQVLPPSVPFFRTIVATFDWRVWLTAVVAAVGVALLTGLIPAWRASAIDPGAPLRAGSVGAVERTRDRYSLLVVAEVALALALTTSAGLLLRATYRLQHRDEGFARDELVTADVRFRASPDSAQDRTDEVLEGLTARLAQLPGVQSVGWTVNVGTAEGMVTAAIPREGIRQLHLRSAQVVSDGYLRTMGTRVVAGRDFEAGDAERGAVIVSERVARALWRGSTPLASRIALSSLRRTPGGSGMATRVDTWLRVIGVAADTRPSGESLDAFDVGTGTIYVTALPPQGHYRSFVLRTTTSRVPEVALATTQLLWTLPQTVRWVRPMAETHTRIARAHALLSRLFAGLAAFALLLAALGLYSVLSYAAVRRRREFAVHLALGAGRGHLARQVGHDAAVMILGGTAVGAALAMWAGSLLDPFLYDLYRVNAPTLVAAELVIGAVLMTVGAGVMRRVSRTDPTLMLRAG